MVCTFCAAASLRSDRDYPCVELVEVFALFLRNNPYDSATDDIKLMIAQTHQNLSEAYLEMGQLTKSEEHRWLASSAFSGLETESCLQLL